jgi:hypothetical protein
VPTAKADKDAPKAETGAPTPKDDAKAKGKDGAKAKGKDGAKARPKDRKGKRAKKGK